MASAKRWGVAVWLAAAALTGAVAPAQAEFKSGSWTGNAYARQDGKFERCVITSEHSGGKRLGFGMSVEGAFEIWLMSKAWTLQQGTPQQVTLWVDDQQKLTGNFQVVSKEAMAAQFPAGSKLPEALKRGNILHMTTPNEALDFKLSGTFKAIGELEKCWAQNTGAKSQAAAPAQPNPAKRVKGMDLLALTPRDFAGQVVTSKKDGYFAIPSDLPEAMRKWNAALVWSTKEGVGLASGIGSNPDVLTLRDTLVRQKQAKCAGEMTSSTGTETLPGTAVEVKRVEIACSNIGDGKAVTELFTFYPHLSGQLLAISHISSNREAAVQADAEFAKRAAAILTAK